MWIVREQIIADKPLVTNHSYTTLAAAEKQFNLLRNNWKNKYRHHEIRLHLVEDNIIIKTRILEPSQDT